MTSFEIVGLVNNRPITQAEIQACRRLVAALAEVAARPSARRFGDEGEWVRQADEPVYGTVTPYGLDNFDETFVRLLRLHCYIFTGYHLSDVITGNKTPSWTDMAAFPLDDKLPDWSILYHLAQEMHVPADLMCAPPIVAGEVGYLIKGRCVNRDIACYQDRISLMHKGGVIDRLRGLERPRILEIGGGYGGLAYFLTRFIPQARYTIIDLPSSLMYSGCYLTVAQNSHAVHAWRGAADSEDAGVMLVSNAMADEIRSQRFDLAINTLSFAEMTAPVVRSYGELIAQVLAPDGQLFEQNYPIYGPDSNFCTPADILKDIFPVRRDVPGALLFGPPRLWSLA